MAKKVLLGYTVGSGKPVYIRMHHLVATGTTQLSGKTTTLEALITRSVMKAIAFRTKRGESAFAASHVQYHAPYYREPTSMPYWQYIQSLLEATMGERMKFERSWIITVTKGARTPRDVLEAVNREIERLSTAREKRKREMGLTESVYTNIKAYLEIVVPAIESAAFTRDLTLRQGVTVMDLVGLRDEVQAIAVAATLETLHEREGDCVVVIPEAWKFVPEGRGTPVKRVLEKVIREGAAVGLYVWFDSQDLAGVDKRPLKNVDDWILGRQREINEVKHTLDQMPLPRASKPKPEEVMRLGLGQFIACFGNEVEHVYARPAWLPEDVAVRIAKGGPISLADPYRPTHVREDTDMESKERELAQKLEENKRELQEAQQALARNESLLREKEKHARELQALLEKVQRLEVATKVEKEHPTPPELPLSPAVARDPDREGFVWDYDAIADRVLERLRKDSRAVELNLERTESTLRVVVAREVVQADESTIKGKLAVLIADGFFDEPRKYAEITAEAKARGWGSWSGGGNRIKSFAELKWLCQNGFLRNEESAYRLLPGVKKRVEVVE